MCKAIVLRKETDADLSKSEMREHPEAPGSGWEPALIVRLEHVHTQRLGVRHHAVLGPCGGRGHRREHQHNLRGLPHERRFQSAEQRKQ